MNDQTIMSPRKPNTRRRNRKRNTKNWPLIFFTINLVLMYARPVDIIPFIAIFKPGLIMALCLGLLWAKSTQYKTDFQEKEIAANFYFLIIGAISVTWASNIGATFSVFQNQIMYIFGFTLAAMLVLKSKDDFSFFLKLWIFIHIYIAYTVISNGGRGTGGIFGDQNDVGAALVMAIPFFYYAAPYFENKLMKYISYTGLILCITAVIITGSRGAFLGLLSVIIGIFFLSKKKLRFVSYGTILLILAASYFVSDEYMKEMQSINDTEDGTRVERLYSWGLGIDMFISNPILGVGAGQYPWALCDFQPDEDIHTGSRGLCSRASHSTYIDLLSEHGTVGIILFYIMMGGCYQRLRKTSKISDRNNDKLSLALSHALSVGFIGVFICGTFISILYYPFLWLQLGLTIALSRYVEKKDKPDAITN